jgi:hypothetical protein
MANLYVASSIFDKNDLIIATITIMMDGFQFAKMELRDPDLYMPADYHDFLNGKRQRLDFRSKKGCIILRWHEADIIECEMSRKDNIGGSSILLRIPSVKMVQPLTHIASFL